MEKQVSVFISYSSKDNEFAKKLAIGLQNANVSVWIDEGEIKVGESLIEKISNSIDEVDYLVVILSPASVASEWVKREVVFAFTQEIEGGKLKVLPLLYQKCDIPSFLRDKRYIDFTGVKRYEDSFAELLRGLYPSSSQSIDKAHLLISDESPFTKKIRKELLFYKKELGIFRDFFDERKRAFEEYKVGMYNFLNDEQAKWLLTIYPDEERVVLDSGDILEKLVSREKRIIFFESGFKKFDHRNPGSKKPPVVCITTDHEEAVKLLIKHLLNAELNERTKLHFVALLGPAKNSVADRRRAIYNEFLAHISLSRDLSQNVRPNWAKRNNDWDWYEIIDPVHRLATLQTTYLRMRTWYRSEAEAIILKEFDVLNVTDRSMRTCFLCGNDDIALGIRDGLVKRLDTPIDSYNVSFYGFDGIDEMLHNLEEQIEGATMKAKIDIMCEKALELIRSDQTILDYEIKIPGIKKISTF